MDFEERRKIKRDKFEMGRQIRKARDAKGWTQSELAERVGVRQPAIAHYESGLHVPKYEVLRRLGKELGKPIVYFYSDTVPSGVFGMRLFNLLWLRISYWWHTRKRNISDEHESQ